MFTEIHTLENKNWGQEASPMINLVQDYRAGRIKRLYM